MLNIDNHDYEVDKDTKIQPPKKRARAQPQKGGAPPETPGSHPATKSQMSGAANNAHPQNANAGPQQRQQPLQEEEPVEQPVNERILLLQQRADAGDANAQFELGQNYYFGNEDLGIEPQRDEAMRYFEQAANNNHQQASVDLAVMLLNSRLA